MKKKVIVVGLCLASVVLLKEVNQKMNYQQDKEYLQVSKVSQFFDSSLSQFSSESSLSTKQNNPNTPNDNETDETIDEVEIPVETETFEEEVILKEDEDEISEVAHEPPNEPVVAKPKDEDVANVKVEEKPKEEIIEEDDEIVIEEPITYNIGNSGLLFDSEQEADVEAERMFNDFSDPDKYVSRYWIWSTYDKWTIEYEFSYWE